MPSFFDVLKVVLQDMQVESAVLADEIHSHNAKVSACAGDMQQAGIAVSLVSHEQFKALTCNARAVIRTGEATPYANVILYSGVVF
ncbi:D-ribose pyranase [Crenobacter oryzisoli]|uniref:D-ribose pyranase n=1 Tax=Crenobacter oryzisoli TaxID=3056844 RepID=UPI003204EF67